MSQQRHTQSADDRAGASRWLATGLLAACLLGTGPAAWGQALTRLESGLRLQAPMGKDWGTPRNRMNGTGSEDRDSARNDGGRNDSGRNDGGRNDGGRSNDDRNNAGRGDSSRSDNTRGDGVRGNATRGEAVASVADPAPTTRQRGSLTWPELALGLLLVVVLLCVLATQWQILRATVPRPQAPPPPRASSAIASLAYLLRRDMPGERHSITRATWHIGRGRDNELRVDDATVSRRHAALRLQEDGNFDIIDLNSSNGTFVNEQRISRHSLQESDIIRVGQAMFYYTHRSEEQELGDLTEAPHSTI